MIENHFKQAVWIWHCDHPQEDEYGEFAQPFAYKEGRAMLRISCDSNYAAYINGQLAAWGQYADFPYDKVYDAVDVTQYCRPGDNRLALLVWYYGTDTTQVYAPGKAGLLFELTGDDKVLCCSSEKTLSRLSRGYQSHRRKQLTDQLGWSFCYDAAREDMWLVEEVEGFSPSVRVMQNPPLRIRPCQKLRLLPEVAARPCGAADEEPRIFDLGQEAAGFLSLEVVSEGEQEVVISYGEHMEDGAVRRKIGTRDFSVVYRTKPGKNVYLNPFRRLACRYLQVQASKPLQVNKIAIAPTVYPLQERKRPELTSRQQKIYQMCVNTLKLCMHEHYEDCPWREQALYAMDSRNQMLCGYYAFGEYEFPRANLQLMAQDRRQDGLLSICFPIEKDLVIPSFTLHYITECREYLDYSSDLAFIREIYPKLASCLEPFLRRMPAGLVLPFDGKSDWNFYEWRPGLDGSACDVQTPDLILNCLLSLALGHMAHIAQKLHIACPYPEMAQQLNARIHEAFWQPAEGRFYDRPLSANEEQRRCSQLGNALAVLCGAASQEEAPGVCEHLERDQDMTPISLSMQCFAYDAWLKTDPKKYRPVILDTIERIYWPMAQAGGSTVWETEKGAADFDGAGSLCHGWSAMPVYYYHILSLGDQ